MALLRGAWPQAGSQLASCQPARARTDVRCGPAGMSGALDRSRAFPLVKCLCLCTARTAILRHFGELARQPRRAAATGDFNRYVRFDIVAGQRPNANGFEVDQSEFRTLALTGTLSCGDAIEQRRIAYDAVRWHGLTAVN